jgi:hypothetical protein
MKIAASPLVVVVSVFAASISSVLLRRGARKSPLPIEGDGVRLVYPRFKTFLGYLGLIACTFLLAYSLYAIWADRNWAATHTGAAFAFVAIFCFVYGGFGWLGFYLIQSGRTQFDLTPAGIAQRRGAFSLVIPWSSVASVKVGLSGACLILNSINGEKIKLYRSLVGANSSLRYLREYLPPELASVADSISW